MSLGHCTLNGNRRAYSLKARNVIFDVPVGRLRESGRGCFDYIFDNVVFDDYLLCIRPDRWKSDGFVIYIPVEWIQNLREAESGTLHIRIG